MLELTWTVEKTVGAGGCPPERTELLSAVLSAKMQSAGKTDVSYGYASDTAAATRPPLNAP